MSTDEIDVTELLNPKKQCVKVVPSSKYERTNPDIQNWWHRLFKKLEETHTVPFYKRETNLEKCFSKSTLKKLRQIGIEVQAEQKDDYITYKENDMFKSTKKDSLSKHGSDSDKSSAEGSCNPYLNFLRKSKARARIWRPSKEPSLAELKLMEKAQTATDRIATQFNDYVQDMGGQTKTQINKEAIVELFEITFNYPPARSLYVRTRLRNCVPENVADAVERPEFAKINKIWSEVYDDIKVDSVETSNVAFGKTLPEELRHKPILDDVREKWTSRKCRDEDLENMATVWKDITNLQSTAAFCKWLITKMPGIHPPKYLQDIGMLDIVTIEKVLSSTRVPEYVEATPSLDELQDSSLNMITQ